MDFKTILENGGYVRFNYKEVKTKFMGEAMISVFSGGFGMQPKIIITIPTSDIEWRKEFLLEDMDEAIKLFIKFVFREKNICFKQHEAIISFTGKGIDIDLEDENDYNKIEIIRKQLILNKL